MSESCLDIDLSIMIYRRKSACKDDKSITKLLFENQLCLPGTSMLKNPTIIMTSTQDLSIYPFNNIYNG